MKLTQRKPKPEGGAAGARTAQIGRENTHPFALLSQYVPLGTPALSLYRSLREAVPVVDAAIGKLIRLTGGVEAVCGEKTAERRLNQFLKSVPTGMGQEGIQSFLDCYLDSLLTAGRAAGEIVLTGDGGDIGAVLCAPVENLSLQTENPLRFSLAERTAAGAPRPLPYPDLLLFTPYRPSPERPEGTSLLHGMPFLAGILLKIFQSVGTNWERAGNLRFSVVYHPPGEGLDPGRAKEQSAILADEWSRAMESTKQGAVRDFVAVGDVSIKAIGSECPIPDCQVPVRLILEQLIAQTGIPPFLLGLSWNSTERMSAQQADVMTSELTALRRSVTPALHRICRLWLRLHGYDPVAELVWSDINLQDTVEEARAELYRQQARRLAAQTAHTRASEEEKE
jgi:hypothetical protein